MTSKRPSDDERKKRRPSAPFYFPDWSADHELGLCTASARGVWFELLCIMHGSQRRGFLLIAGKKPNVAQLAPICRLPEEVVRTGIGELVTNGVCSVDEEGVIYCRRMKREEEDAERAREWGKMSHQAGDQQLDAAGRIAQRRAADADRQRARRAARKSAAAGEQPAPASAYRPRTQRSNHVTVRGQSADSSADSSVDVLPESGGFSTPVTGVEAGPDPSPFPSPLPFKSSSDSPPAERGGPPSPSIGGGPPTAKELWLAEQRAVLAPHAAAEANVVPMPKRVKP